MHHIYDDGGLPGTWSPGAPAPPRVALAQEQAAL